MSTALNPKISFYKKIIINQHNISLKEKNNVVHEKNSLLALAQP
jgi:hypothetical protein